MNGKELSAAIARVFCIDETPELRRTINRAIRTLPGGSETLDAIESLNAARNHASKHKAHDKVVAIDAAIDRVENIRSAMANYVLAKANESA